MSEMPPHRHPSSLFPPPTHTFRHTPLLCCSLFLRLTPCLPPPALRPRPGRMRSQPLLLLPANLPHHSFIPHLPVMPAAAWSGMFFSSKDILLLKNIPDHAVCSSQSTWPASSRAGETTPCSPHAMPAPPCLAPYRDSPPPASPPSPPFLPGGSLPGRRRG